MNEYVIGTDRCLMHTDSPLLEGWEECCKLDDLKAHASSTIPAMVKPCMKWKGNKMPARLFTKVLGTAAKFPNMETGYVLWYNLDKGEWDVTCPDQIGYGAYVKFEDTKKRDDGFSEIGTIHTHPNMGAFWSGTDLNDQAKSFGVHIVLGLTAGKPSTVLCSIFTAVGRYDKPLTDIVEEVDLKADYEPCKEWLDKIASRPPKLSKYLDGALQKSKNAAGLSTGYGKDYPDRIKPHGVYGYPSGLSSYGLDRYDGYGDYGKYDAGNTGSKRVDPEDMAYSQIGSTLTDKLCELLDDEAFMESLWVLQEADQDYAQVVMVNTADHDDMLSKILDLIEMMGDSCETEQEACKAYEDIVKKVTEQLGLQEDQADGGGK